MAIMNELIEETKEIGNQQVADVERLDITISGQHYFFIAQALQIVLDIEAAHHIVHLIILVYDIPLEVPNIERFAFEHENRLRIHVPATDNRAGGRLAFGQEDHGTLPF